MNSSPLRQLILVSLSLAAVHCAPADGADTADLPEEAASALAQTYSFDASDCWGSITYCPGSTTLIESCYLSSGAASDGAGGAAHRVHTYDPGNSTWHWTQCANGSTIQMYCQGPGQQTVASCTTEFGPGASYGIVGTRRLYSPTTGLWTLMQNNGLEGTAEYHPNGFLKSYFPVGSYSHELSAQGLYLKCATYSYLSLDEDSNVTYCTLAPDIYWGTGPKGVTVTQGGGSFFCPSNAYIEFGANGFVKRCGANIDFTTLRGTTVSLGLAEFDDNGFLIASTARLATATTLTTRLSGAVNCAANSAVTFDADGYLRTCNITAGQTESFQAQGQSPVNVSCRGTFSLDTAGRVGYCSALAGDRALRPPPLGTTQQPNVTCKDGQAVNFTTDGFMTRCTPTVATNFTTRLASAPTASCASTAAVFLGGSGTSRGYLSSCTLASNLATSLPAIGLGAAAPLTCKSGAELRLFPSTGYVQRCMPTAGVAVRIGDSPFKAVPCAGNQYLDLSSTGRLTSCTFGGRFKTDGFASGNSDRVCAGGRMPTFISSTSPTVRELVSQVRANSDLASPAIGINAGNTLCLLDLDALCTSNAQCDSGLCAFDGAANRNECSKKATGAACSHNDHCTSNVCSASLCQ